MFSSVVIPAYQNVDLLRECLERFESQTVSNFEVVVVSDGCDDVVSFLESYESTFSLRYFNTNYEGFGVALARNLGIYHAQGEQIISVDPDCMVESDFVFNHQKYYESGLLLVGSTISVQLDEIGCIDYVCMAEQRDVFFRYENLEELEFGIDFAIMAYSNNFSFSKQDAMLIGGFDVANFLDQGGSDTDFARRFLLQFDRLKFIRNPVYHVGIMSNIFNSNHEGVVNWPRNKLAELSNRLAPIVPFIKEV